jgi:hypothetical protein
MYANVYSEMKPHPTLAGFLTAPAGCLGIVIRARAEHGYQHAQGEDRGDREQAPGLPQDAVFPRYICNQKLAMNL